ncbi:hypothetical protein ENSA5_54940 [Enhygromyxa salina]|uniref:Uncharacterized protein n=1 Tax=Enhygromyxa salina TaxID=215803 RepID=A0A2S9XEV5_9BACT|nr:hypothetical protein ENSA5_54940 [Enhygromyxa salina]
MDTARAAAVEVGAGVPELQRGVAPPRHHLAVAGDVLEPPAVAERAQGMKGHALRVELIVQVEAAPVREGDRRAAGVTAVREPDLRRTGPAEGAHVIVGAPEHHHVVGARGRPLAHEDDVERDAGVLEQREQLGLLLVRRPDPAVELGHHVAVDVDRISARVVDRPRLNRDRVGVDVDDTAGLGVGRQQHEDARGQRGEGQRGEDPIQAAHGTDGTAESGRAPPVEGCGDEHPSSDRTRAPVDRPTNQPARRFLGRLQLAELDRWRRRL